MGEWERLKKAVDAGYYTPDAVLSATATGEPFPWQNKTCKDCPFWGNNICLVRSEYRSAKDHTCPFFDRCNHEEAAQIIEAKAVHGFQKWWSWWSGL